MRTARILRHVESADLNAHTHSMVGTFTFFSFFVRGDDHEMCFKNPVAVYYRRRNVDGSTSTRRTTLY